MHADWRNTYYAIRHGTSVANERGVIVSQPQNAIAGWGLSAAGVVECRERFAADRLPLAGAAADVLVVSSDFRRATETAAILCAVRGLTPHETDTGLRERSFGALELGPAEHYREVWERDCTGHEPVIPGVESTGSVAARMLAVIARIERSQQHRTVVLISHGDPLQILETVLAGAPSHTHRERRHWANAEARRLGRNQGSAR